MSRRGPNSASGAGRLYAWGDGHGKVHSRRQKGAGAPQAVTHTDRGRGAGGAQAPPGSGLGYLTGPQTMPQIQREANVLTGLQYGGQEQALGQRQAAVAPWFQNYMNTIQGAQTQTAQMQQPAIDQANQAVTNQTTTPGIDPGSTAAHDDALAAAGRAALLKLGAESLQGIQNSGSNFFGAQQAIAPMYRQQVTQDLGNQQSQLQRDKGAYRVGQVTDLVNQNRQYGIDLQHGAVESAAFGLNQDNVLADNARADQQLASSNSNQAANRKAKRQAARAKTKQDRAKYIAQYGIAPENVSDGLTPAEKQQMAAYKKSQSKGSGGAKGLTPYQRQQNRKARNDAVQSVSDVVSNWGQYSTEQVPAVKGPDGNIIAAHKPSANEIRNRLKKEGATQGQINLALALRRKTLTQADVRLAKRLGIWPLPAQWRQYIVPAQPPATGGTVKQGAAAYPYGSGAGSVH